MSWGSASRGGGDQEEESCRLANTSAVVRMGNCSHTEPHNNNNNTTCYNKHSRGTENTTIPPVLMCR